MVETDTARLGLRRWSSGLDTPSRVDFDSAHAILDELVAIDRQDTLPNRPAPAVRGTYFFDTASSVLFRDTGTAWTVVGSRVSDAVSTASATNTVPLTVTGTTGHTAALLEARAGNAVKAAILADGSITGATFTGRTVDLTATTPTLAVLSGRAAPGHSADLLSLTRHDGATLWRIRSDGGLDSAHLSTGPGRGVIGAANASNVTGMALFGGTPALEVHALTGGAGSAFTDFIYLKHAAATTPALRRLGIVLKVGDEIPADATKTGGLYLESSAASFANPKLVLMRADTPVMQFPATGFGAIEQSMTINGQLALNPGTANPSLLLGATQLGVQAGDLYLRVGSGAGIAFYAGGSHSPTAGDAGGGAALGRLDTTGTLSVNRLRLLTVADASAGQAAPSLQIGPSSSGNLIVDDNEVMARNNGAVADLLLNADGGGVQVGGPTSFVTIPGTLAIGGRRLTIAANPPAAPAPGDVWIDI